MKKIYSIALIAGLLLTWGNMYAGNEQRAGQAGASELLINPWAASSGWADAGSSSIHGIEALFHNVAGTAYDGGQFAELDTYENSYIEQDVATGDGFSYLLSFAYSPRVNQLDTTNGIDVLWNGSILQSITATGGSVNDWTIFEFIVQGTVGIDTLKFAATGTSDSLGGNLDAISLSQVPVPAALFLFAPALLGFLGLRRKTRA